MHKINCEKQMDMESLFSLLKEESSDANRIIKKKSSGSIRGDVATLSLEAFDAFKSPKMTDVEDFVFSNIIKPEWGGWDLVKDSSRNGDIKFWIKQAWDEKFPPDKGREDTRIIQKPKKGEVVQLCYWKQDEAAVPWTIISSCLYGTEIKKRGRRAFVNEKLVSWGKNFSMSYTGVELVQSDLDVTMELVRLAIEQNGRDLASNTPEHAEKREGVFGVPVKFTANEFLKSIDRKPTGNNHRWLRNTLAALGSINIKFSAESDTENVGISGPFIHQIKNRETVTRTYKDSKTGKKETKKVETGVYEVWISLRHIRIYRDGHTAFPKADRQGLSPMAKWLHLFSIRHVSSDRPVWVECQKLMSMMRSDISKSWDFRMKIESAMNELSKVGIVCPFYKKERGKNGKLKNKWWESSGTPEGETKYTLVFKPAYKSHRQLSSNH